MDRKKLISNDKGMANEINISRTALARKCVDSFLNRVVLPVYCFCLRISSAFGYKLLQI